MQVLSNYAPNEVLLILEMKIIIIILAFKKRQFMQRMRPLLSLVLNQSTFDQFPLSTLVSSVDRGVSRWLDKSRSNFRAIYQ